MSDLRGRIALIATIMATALCASMPSFADTIATYSASDKPTSLADGKISFAYDNENKITELQFTPNVGEKLMPMVAYCPRR